MEAYFNVIFEIRKGLGPDTFLKTIAVGFDDLPPDTTDYELRQMAILEAESYLYKSEDYHLYRKNWKVAEVERG